jgi:hypothetical protein
VAIERTAPAWLARDDLGPNTLQLFSAMELFDPDKTWSPVNAY